MSTATIEQTDTALEQAVNDAMAPECTIADHCQLKAEWVLGMPCACQFLVCEPHRLILLRALTFADIFSCNICKAGPWPASTPLRWLPL